MANERPSIFRPSAIVRLTVRFDEYDDTGALRARLPPLAPGAAPVAQPTQPSVQTGGSQPLLAQIQGYDDAIQSAIDSGASQSTIDTLRTERQGLVSQLGGWQVGDEQQPMDYVGGPSPDDRVHTIEILPISVEIERNSLRTADTATISFDFKDLPTDARLIRSSAVEITVGVVDPSTFELGTRGARRDGGLPLSAISRDDRNATRFVGVVDTWKVVFDEDDGDQIEIECRDFSALCLDTPLATGTGIDLTRPLDQGVQTFLRDYPSFAAAAGRDGIKVFYGRPGETGIAPTPARAAPQSTRPRRGRGGRAPRQGDQNTNLWDHITDVCGRVGLLPVFYDYDLHLIDPRTFYSPRDVPTRMVYGRNLKHFEVSRKLGGIRVPTIEVRAYDPDIGRTRWARYPVPRGQEATASAGILGVSDPPQRPYRANDVSVSGWTPTESIQTILVQGVNDPDVLRRIARSSFEQIGRQEIEGNIETDVVTSYSPQDTQRGRPGDAADQERFQAKQVGEDAADLLHLTSGDAIEILIAGGPRAPHEQLAGLTAEQLVALTRQAREDYLVTLGWSRSAAAGFARVADAVAFQTIFRVQNVRVSFAQEDGISVACDFINFITVREEAETNPASSPAGEASTTSLDLSGISAATHTGDVLVAAQQARDVIQQQRADGVISQDQYQEQLAQIQEAVSASLEGEG